MSAPTAMADYVLHAMEQSFDYDVKEVFFGLWAKSIGIDWNELGKEERKFVMTRLNYAWYRAVSG